ncbi:MAG: phytanoyl-CoA dioxygenase family protein [Phenylobacterium sp.]|uniref:phytanoyl-CoA dioxygenase family protein n=1 Tax=Phenylobacterium sp. TaxID=1871053 RepID=UPI001A402AFE|nr:phytanoyl-CoA dioxygenase family protein [Phenylobacterium sp.]MBL8555330.1 phytanoyl-CoA dioxygenase family protein [Phenylobacterium sp.]
MERPGLTPEQHAQYEREGVVRLPGAVPPPAVEAMVATLWRRLAGRHGIRRDHRESWHTANPAQLAAHNDDFAAMASPQVLAVIDQLLGPGGWKPPPRWGLPLVTLPGFTARWDVPHKLWHLDLPAAPEPPRVARVFLLLSPLAAGGGGTGYVAGSHRVLHDLARETGRTLKSGDARKLLTAREPWFEALFTRRPGEDRIARFMQAGGMAGGAPVRVGEMTGEAGDVYVMDPLILHGTMPNAAATPRLMLTEWIYGRDGRPA